MTGTTTTTAETPNEKKLRKIIEEKLAITLLEFKLVLGEKKFNSRIRKAGKLFSGDITKAQNKKQLKKVKTK